MAGGAYPLARERNIILASLLLLAGGAWALVTWQSMSADNMAMGGGMGLTLGLGAPLFLANWVAMMVAIMFPTAAPMVLVFARVHAGRRQQGQSYVPTWVFAASYLVVWSAVGAVAYGAAVGLERLAEHSTWLMDNSARLGGGVVVLIGLYQLTPLKLMCLTKCRTPLSFVMTSWRDGYRGAVRMGLEHGLYCLGCCWMLFVLLFPLGIMNVAAMALIAVLIFAEKSTPIGRPVARAAATALVAYGLVVVFVPSALPTTL